MVMNDQTVVCETPDFSHVEKFGLLFGYPIAHSYSPLMHQTVYDNIGYKWQQFLLESTDMSHFLELMSHPKFYGASVTMPHKVTILSHLDELTDEGRAVGACNTVFLKHVDNRRIYVGTNTDIIGIRDAFWQNMPDRDAFQGKPALVVGGGGAARSAIYTLKIFMKATTVYLVNRDKAEVDAVISWCGDHGYGEGLVHVATVDQAHAAQSVGAVVACVPNFTPASAAEIEARNILVTFLDKSKGAILEMCYHPKPWTQISELAEKAGWKVILGTEAMIYQGCAQDSCWTGKTIAGLPVTEVEAAIAEKLKAPDS
ncbi:shikimate/quinate 5-dehydrogenase [Aureobasidium subglaciale]|nr:shikimate/quinate 5-dehydrogenase [Aureobasidium subglaciale]